MRYFITHVLIYSLLTWQLGPVYAASDTKADSEAVSNEATKLEKNVSDAAKKAKDELTNGSDDNDKITPKTANTSSYDATPDIDLEDMKNTSKMENVFTHIMLLSSAITAPFIGYQCGTRFDWVPGALGSLVYLGFEIYMIAELKESSTQEFKYYENVDKNDQLKAFEAALTRTKELLKQVNIRQIMQMAVSIAYTLSTALAIVFAIKDIATCISKAGGIGAAACTGCPARAGGCPVAPACLSAGDAVQSPTPFDNHSLEKNSSLFVNNELFDKTKFFPSKKNFNDLNDVLKSSPDDLHSFLLMEEYNRLSKGETQSLSYDSSMAAVEILGNNVGKDNYLKGVIKEISSNFSKYGNYLIPSAHALDLTNVKDDEKKKELGIKLGLGLGAAALGVGITVFLAKRNTTIINGWVRSAISAVSTAFGWAAWSQTKKMEENVTKQKEAYEGLIKKIKAALTRNGLAVTPPNPTPVGAGLLPILTPGSTALKSIQQGLCDTTSAASTAFSTMSTSCRCGGQTCSAVKLKNADYKGINYPGIGKTMGSLGDAANSTINGDLGSAGGSVNDFNSGLATNQKALKDLKDKANLLLPKVGTNPIDFDKLNAKSKDDLFKDFKKGFNKLSDREKKAAYDWADKMSGGFGASAPPSAVVAEEKNEEEKETDIIDEKVVVKAQPKKLANLFDFMGDDGKKNKKRKKRPNRKRKNMDKLLKKYKYKTNDISKKSESDLFKIIQIRYFKSAFPIFFKRK